MKKNIETLCVQAGYRPGNGEPRQIPIIQSTTFRYENADEMAKLLTWRPTAISTAVCKIRPATALRPRSPHWKAARRRC